MEQTRFALALRLLMCTIYAAMGGCALGVILILLVLVDWPNRQTTWTLIILETSTALLGVSGAAGMYTRRERSRICLRAVMLTIIVMLNGLIVHQFYAKFNHVADSLTEGTYVRDQDVARLKQVRGLLTAVVILAIACWVHSCNTWQWGFSSILSSRALGEQQHMHAQQPEQLQAQQRVIHIHVEDPPAPTEELALQEAIARSLGEPWPPVAPGSHPRTHPPQTHPPPPQSQPRPSQEPNEDLYRAQIELALALSSAPANNSNNRVDVAQQHSSAYGSYEDSVKREERVVEVVTSPVGDGAAPGGVVSPGSFARLEQLEECLVCMEAPAVALCNPCVHRCLCRPCGVRVMCQPRPRCPLCRRDLLAVQ